MCAEVDLFRRDQPTVRGFDRGLLSILGDWSSGGRPLWRRLAAAIEAAIDDGALGPGRRLPSERQLAGMLAVSRTTVAAYDSLRERGLLDSRRGSGTRVSLRARPLPDGHPPLVHARPGDADIISADRIFAGDDPADPEIEAAVRDMLAEDLPTLLACNGWQPHGLPALRRAIADQLTDSGLPTSPDQVLVTNGADQAIALVTGWYVRPNRPVVVENPACPRYLDIFGSAGGRPLGVPVDDGGIHVERLRRALAENAPALLCVMPAVQDPTGILMPEPRRQAIARLTARFRAPVVEVNTYDTDGSGLPPIAAYADPNAEILTVGSAPATPWSGPRIGWVRAPSRMMERLTRGQNPAGGTVSLLDQAVAARLLRRCPELAARRAAEHSARLDLLESLLHNELPAFRWRRPDGGTGLWVRLPEPAAVAFSQLALRHGAEIVPGPATDPGGHDNWHVRIPFGYPPPTIAELVRRLARAWCELDAR
jgi:DNA-binding transcriptional MocR family regulator